LGSSALIRQPFGIRVLCVLVLWCHATSPVWAQGPTGPFAGLFAGDQVDRGTLLDLRGSLSGQYNNDPSVDESGAGVDPRFLTSSGTTAIDGKVNYHPHPARWGAFQLNGGGALQYYRASHSASGTYDIGSSLIVNLTRNLELGAKGGFAYAPFFGLAPLLSSNGPSASVATEAFGFADLAQPNRTIDGSLTLTSNYSRQSSLEADVSWSDTRFLGSVNGRFRTMGAHGLFRHHVTRPLAFHLGYGVDSEHYSQDGGAPFANQIIDVGLDYGDTLSFARRFSFAFSTGTSIIHQGAQAANPATQTQAQGATTEYQLTGTAVLTTSFRRTWNVSLDYSRGTRFIPGFQAPVLEDSANAWIRGLLSRRLQWSSGGGISRGDVVGSSDSAPFTAYTATAKLEVAFNRSVGGFAEYSYYYDKVSAGSTIFEILPQLSRHVWIVGLNVWAPIIRDVRGSK
jgi:hypothetical protein